MTLIVFGLWIAFNAILLNIAIKIGWNFDPGFIGPSIIIFIFNLIIALYSRKKSES